MMKIQILLVYFERPKIILNALKSIKIQSYKNWELHFIDDGSIQYPGRKIVEDFFNEEELNKTFFYNSNDTIENKLKRGSIHGHFLNEAIRSTNSELCIILCDDDALHPNYLENLNNFYSLHSNVNYAYSHVIPFDPFTENFEQVPARHCSLNYVHPLNPRAMVDSSQVSWRRNIIIENNILYPSPQTFDLDAAMWGSLFEKLGPCIFTGFYSQYKGFHSKQMGTKRNKQIEAFQGVE